MQHLKRYGIYIYPFLLKKPLSNFIAIIKELAKYQIVTFGKPGNGENES